ncbi:MAG: hypothetical protein HY420_03490 [Candidatus Kerfeldbacteria bacterium]|nr:hypothetical protein [Candidatus Kerfeldbacteria bacterium]
MFENEPNPTTPDMPSAAPPPPVAQDIHTMPERFLDTGVGAPAPSGPTGGGGKKIIVVAVVIVVVGALAAGAWYYFTKLANKNSGNTVANATNVVTNRNLNVNRPANANLNLNAPLNANVNATTNINLNANLNANQNANANTNSTTIGSPLPSSADTDNDGLTDTEEQVYGTQSNSQDTDGDGFIDGYRVLASGKIEGEAYLGYCPTQKGSARLDDATVCPVMRTYTNPSFNYALWLPRNWVAQVTNSQDNKTLIMTPDFATSEFFQVTVQDNPTQLTAKNWYVNLNPGVDPSKVKDATVSGLDGVLSLDQSSVYFVKGTKIYILSYNTDALNKANLRTTFIIIYRSFHLVPATTPTNSNSNSNANSNTNTNSNINTNSPPILGQ